MPFDSRDELAKFFKDYADAARRDPSRQGELDEAASPQAASGTIGGREEPITNTQSAGVDEGGIVKTHGDYLVILRRGRLFTVKAAESGLEPVAAVDAFGPDLDPQGAWYDEMLVSKDHVFVIGYSYVRGGTEVGLFDIDDAGAIKYRSTYQLRSGDYYSSRNYASRLVGDKLVFYAPLPIESTGESSDVLPAVRRWTKGATAKDFVTTIEPTRIYRPLSTDAEQLLHTVTACGVVDDKLDCKSTAVMGPPGRSFYVSTGSVYVWMSPWSADTKQKDARSLLYRLPLDGGEPSAARVRGGPTDQFSFLEEGSRIDVLVRDQGNGDAMWSSERSSGAAALMQLDLSALTKDAAEAPTSAYIALPSPKNGTLQNRFVGDVLLYGTGSGWIGQGDSEGTLWVVPIAAPAQAKTLGVGHNVDRIEALGKNAIVVGAKGAALHFTSIALNGSDSKVAGHYVQEGAAQGELRSHGFFYKPDGDKSGVLGLPIRASGGPGSAFLDAGSASILFLKNNELKLTAVGSLSAHTDKEVDDACRASCVDWYGNARPIFWRGRVYGLMGYELVEGSLDGASIKEVRRTHFGPKPAASPKTTAKP
ncbi:MAG: beta-propeller domain-containing protein [Polyangiaceae bacterium]